MMVRRGQNRVRRLVGDRQGVVSLEFALVALPFLILIMAILELGIMILQESVMYGALEEGAREIRTGVVQKSENPEAAFRETVCAKLSALLGCDDVVWDVRTFTKYADINLDDLQTGPDGLPNNVVFDPGGAREISTLRIYSLYNFVTPFLETLFEDGANGRLLIYTAVVKGEPWD